MTNEIKVIDLLKLVYEKNAPKKILYKYCEYEFNEMSNDYENKDGLELFSYLFQNEEQALWKDIEIIEDIDHPKPEKWGKPPIEELESKELSLKSMQKYLKAIIETQNEIIDCLPDKEEK